MKRLLVVPALVVGALALAAFALAAPGHINKQALFRHWQDRGHGAGTFLKEKFKGDIADA